MTRNLSHLAAISNVDADYRHYAKDVIALPDHDLALPDAHLKWYEVREPQDVVDPALREDAKSFLRAEAASGELDISGDLGFAIHHLCRGDFYFLIVCTWRRENEMWETVYIRDVKQHDSFRRLEQGKHREVLCVWEMGALLHEQQAWIRYLYSDRDEQAKIAYLDDRFTGSV
ncbi:hypothetical protein AB0H12_01615 [Actinosynnema sp. NPDC023794]